MLFDEFYTEDLYRHDSVVEAIENADALMLIGTAFYTSLAQRVVRHAVRNNIKIIELNKELQIETDDHEQICQLQGCSEILLPQIVE